MGAGGLKTCQGPATGMPSLLYRTNDPVKLMIFRDEKEFLCKPMG
jgi:hypothetical protein